MIPKKNVFVKYRAVQGHTYLVNKSEAFQLDDVGQKIWENIDGKATKEEIAIKIAESYKTEVETISNDLNEFLDELEENKLITTS